MLSTDPNETVEPGISMVADTTPGVTEASREVEQQRIRLLHKNALTGTAMVVPTVLIFLIVLWMVTSHVLLIAWCAAMAAVLINRAFVSYRFLQIQGCSGEPNGSDDRLLIALAMYGCTWGVAGVVFFVSNSIPYQIFLSVMLLGSALGSLWSLHLSKSAVRIIVVPALVPLAGRFFFELDAFGMTLGTLVLFVTLALVTVSARAERSAIRPLEFGVQTAFLRDELGRSATFLQSVLANTNEALCAFDNDWRLSLDNEQFAHLLRLPPLVPCGHTD